MARKRITGHGELLKALSVLPGCTNLNFRIAAIYLAHAMPPVLKVYPSAKTVAGLANCSVRSVHRAKDWLAKVGAALIIIGGGRNNTTVVDFTPLADRVISDAPVTVPASKHIGRGGLNGDSSVTVSESKTVTSRDTETLKKVSPESGNSDVAVTHEGPNKVSGQQTTLYCSDPFLCKL